VSELKERHLPTLRWTDEPAEAWGCEHMLVMLTEETWTRGETSDTLAHEVCEAMRDGIHRLLVHEVMGARVDDNEARHACSFEQVIGTTPRHLVDARLYNEIAMNMAGGEWREAGLAKMARQLCKGSGTRELWKAAIIEPDLEEDAAANAARTSAMSRLRVPTQMGRASIMEGLSRMSVGNRRERASTCKPPSDSLIHAHSILPAFLLAPRRQLSELLPEARVREELASASEATAGGSSAGMGRRSVAAQRNSIADNRRSVAARESMADNPNRLSMATNNL